MNAEITIGASCDAATATEAENILGLMPEFIELDKQGYEPVFGEMEVCDVKGWELDEIWAEAKAIQERGFAKIQEILETDPHGSFKIDHGEHEFEDGSVGFWFIVSKYK